MATASNQKQASLVRRIRFTSKGASYTALFTSDRGNLYQQYKDSATYGDCVPNFKVTKPTLKPVVNSSASTDPVTVTDIDYYIGTTKLTWDAAGNCTNAGWQTRFKRLAGALQLTDNVADLFLGKSFDIKAVAHVGNDSVTAVCNVSVSKYTEGSASKVIIGMDTTKNLVNGTPPDPYTIDDVHDRLTLFTIVNYGGAEYDNPTKINDSTVGYQWQRLTAGTWSDIAGATGPRLEVTRDMVDTYTHFKVIVTLAGAEIGTDSQTVFDASDPLEIQCNYVYNKGGGATNENTYEEELDDTLPDDAYLQYSCRLMRNGAQVSEAVTWRQAGMYNMAGLLLFNVKPNGGTAETVNTTGAATYKVTAGLFNKYATDNSMSANGDYDFVIECEI